MRRRRLSRSKSRRMFSRTASRSHKRNRSTRIMRGGLRI